MNLTLRTNLTLVVVALFALALSGCGGGSTAGTPDASMDVTADMPGTDTTEAAMEDNPVGDFVLVDGAICLPGTTQCFGSNFLECSEDGTDWISTPCEEGASCTPEGCQETECPPNEPACDEDGNAVVCLPDGSGWGPPKECEEGSFCTDGLCIKEACNSGDRQCAGSTLLDCVDGEWIGTPCDEGWICFKEQCVECFSDEHCPEGMACVDGTCGLPPLEIVTSDLPDGQVGTAYTATLEAEGGDGGYVWTVNKGILPPGVDLAEDGTLAGTPDTKGEFPFMVQVDDDSGAMASAGFTVIIHDTGLVILSKSPLPNATEGEPYSFQFEASGGQTPYGWMVLSGDVPAGVNLLSGGLLDGTPTNAHGQFDFEVRAVDAGNPIASAAKSFQLLVEVAPLEIIADTIIDLFLTKVVILPLITIVEGIPIPYNTQLQAKGGIKPYHWAESELSGFISGFIPKAGVPDGLTLADDGKLSGAVTDTSLVFELNIPFMNFALKGFFFMAEVRDSQNPQDSATAIYLIPTVPINFGGFGL